MRQLFVAGLLLLFVAGCKEGKETEAPNVYNDRLVDLLDKGIAVGEEFPTLLETNLDSAKMMLPTYANEYGRLITQVKTIKPYKGDSTFRDAILHCFEFYKHTHENEYVKLVDLMAGGEEMQQQKEEYLEYLKKNVITKEEQLDAEIYNSQRSFASKNNLIIPPRREEPKTID